MKKTVAVVPFILFSLLAAIWSGWLRIGWNFPVTEGAAHHGAFMVNSFLASLIILEKATTFKNKAVMWLPMLNALSAVFFSIGLNGLAQIVLVIGSTGFVFVSAYFVYKHKEIYTAIFLLGAVCLLIGNVILLKTNFYPAAVTWWMGFLLFIIVGERLELSKFLPLSNTKRLLLVISLSIVLGALLLPFHSTGRILFAFGMIATALWLLLFDMARRSIKVKGQHRYAGLLLLIGFGWLLVTGIFLLVQNRLTFGYDATLHSFFIGFVFSMIFSHAPIILPAITKLPVKVYRPYLYYWFALLQASLIERIVADLIESVKYRKLAGLTNGISILLFFVTIALVMKEEMRKRKPMQYSSTEKAKSLTVNV